MAEADASALPVARYVYNTYMSNVIELRQRSTLEICDQCGFYHAVSVLEARLAIVSPFHGKCPQCGHDMRKVYEGNFLGGQPGREDR